MEIILLSEIQHSCGTQNTETEDILEGEGNLHEYTLLFKNETFIFTHLGPHPAKLVHNFNYVSSGWDYLHVQSYKTYLNLCRIWPQ